MSVRKEVQAGDDAVGADDKRGPVIDQEGNPFGLNDEDAAAFREMQENSGPNVPIVEDGADDDGGQVSRDVNADADAAARAAIAKDGQQQDQQDGQQAAKDPKAAAQQDGADDDEDDGEDPTQGGKFPQRVSYQRMQRVRQRAQKAESELATTKENLARIDERYKLIVEALEKSAKPQAQPGAPASEAEDGDLGPAPDPEQDIFAYAKWQAKYNERLRSELDDLRNGVTQRDESTALHSNYTSDVQKFTAERADFPKAYEFMMATRSMELAIQYFGIDLTEEGAQLTPQQADRIVKTVEAEERQLAKIALDNKQSPARQLYLMAKARGYRPAQANGGEQQQQQNGKAPAAKAQNGQQQNGKARTPVGDAVRAAKMGVETNRSLSEGGGAPETNLTAQQVQTMSDDDFAVFLNTATPEQLRSVFGS